MTLMMLMVIVMVMMIVDGTVSPTFRLKSSLHTVKSGTESLEHFFNHVIGPDPQGIFANVGGEMPISQVPGQSHQLMVVRLSDLY